MSVEPKGKKMETKIEKQDGNIVKVEFEIDAKEAEKEYQKTCKVLSQRVNIPGFRRGKAPQKMVEQQLGTDYIKRTALDFLLPPAFSKIINDNKFEVITEPFVEKYEFELGSPLKIEAKFELKPEVKMGDYKGLTIEIEEFKIDDDAMQKELDTLCERFATNKEVTDRKTVATDIVNIDFEGTANGELIKGGSAKGYQLDLGHSNFIPGFAEQIVDKELNSEFDINVTFPEEYHEESLKGAPAVFKIKLNRIMERVIPELTDELAKRVGPFKNIDELKADIQKYLEHTKQTEENKRYAQALFEKVLANAKVDIQETMIARETAQLMQEFKANVEQQGAKWEDILEKEGQDKIRENLKEEAEARIKNSLVIQEIQSLENIEVTPQDVEKKFADLAKMYGTDTKTLINQFKGNPNVIYSITQQVLTEKVMEFLTNNNTVKVK